MALGNIRYFRHFDGVVRQLCGKGHTVVILSNGTIRISNLALRACLAEARGCSYEPMIMPKNRGWYRLLSGIRGILNYSIFFTPGHPSPKRAERRARCMPRVLRPLVRNGLMRRMLVAGPTRKMLRRIEAAVPVDPDITTWLAEQRPDVVFASPFLLQYAIEVEYVRAAMTLNTPTVLAVASWDNLTTKGTFHVIPDVTLVWNEAMREEAATIHSVPAGRIVTTGAPPFDYWFEAQPIVDRETFCRQVGLDPQRPFIVYVGSSRSITQNEVPFVKEFASCLAAHPELRDVKILMRRHPSNAADWKDFKEGTIRLWPPTPDTPDLPESRRTYRNSLYHAHAVVGINTSAFLDAACADRPCVTILAERYRSGQTDLGHFHHLLNAEFLQAARDGMEAATMIARIVGGEDAKAEQRRRFVRTFIRPRGFDHAASDVSASVIEQTALHRSALQIDAALRNLPRDGASIPVRSGRIRDPVSALD